MLHLPTFIKIKPITSVIIYLDWSNKVCFNSDITLPSSKQWGPAWVVGSCVLLCRTGLVILNSDLAFLCYCFQSFKIWPKSFRCVVMSIIISYHTGAWPIFLIVNCVPLSLCWWETGIHCSVPRIALSPHKVSSWAEWLLSAVLGGCCIKGLFP